MDAVSGYRWFPLRAGLRHTCLPGLSHVELRHWCMLAVRLFWAIPNSQCWSWALLDSVEVGNTTNQISMRIPPRTFRPRNPSQSGEQRQWGRGMYCLKLGCSFRVQVSENARGPCRSSAIRTSPRFTDHLIVLLLCMFYTICTNRSSQIGTT